MKKFLVRVAALAAVSVAASCGPLFGETPGTIMPAPPPQPPEPVLVRSGPVFAYDTGNGVLAAITGPDAVQHEVLLDHVAVRVRTPPGWVSSQAGYAVWFQSENESSRFVVYPVANHGAEFHELWYDRDLHDPAVRVSPLQSCDSSWRPLLYTYERLDDGRRGIVYAMLTNPADSRSGILVHGSWPADQDRELRPIVVAAANGVVLVER